MVPFAWGVFPGRWVVTVGRRGCGDGAGGKKLGYSPFFLLGGNLLIPACSGCSATENGVSPGVTT